MTMGETAEVQTVPFDHERFNEAASVVYEVAFARGSAEGRGHERDLVSHEHAVSMLELAGSLARAADIAEDDEVALSFARFARRALGATPYEHRVREAIRAADSAMGDGRVARNMLIPLGDAIEAAGRETRESLDELRGA